MRCGVSWHEPCVDEMDSLQSSHTADIVSDDATETQPNFVITVDPLLKGEPDNVVVENVASKA